MENTSATHNFGIGLWCCSVFSAWEILPFALFPAAWAAYSG